MIVILRMRRRGGGGGHLALRPKWMYLQAYLFEIEELSSVSYILRNFKKYFKILNTAAWWPWNSSQAGFLPGNSARRDTSRLGSLPRNSSRNGIPPETGFFPKRDSSRNGILPETERNSSRKGISLETGFLPKRDSSRKGTPEK